MKDERRDQVRDHDFDGIQEFDNRLPNWWIGTFVLTVLFGLYHWLGHHTFEAKPTIRQEYERDMKEILDTQAAKGGSGPTDEAVLAAYKDPAQVAAGKTVFMANCIACHMADGGGGIGVNFTDDYWLHGNRPGQIATTITNGVPDKGMVTWKGVLTPDQIIHVAAYVMTLHGTKPAKPKAPQGELLKWTLD